MTTTLRQIGVAVLALLVLTVVTGVVYPAVVWGVGRIAASKADGSFITDKTGAVVGSSLIGQNFADAKWFHSRPSAAGSDGYDAMSSGASNLGPNSHDLLKAVNDRKAAAAKEDGVDPSAVPPDALTASGSGLDPDISPAYALEQVNRVATARGLQPSAVAALVEQNTAGRDLGFMGQPKVNVLELNLALQAISG